MIKFFALITPLLFNLFGAIILISTADKNFRNRFYLGLFFANSFILFTGHFLSFFEFWRVFKYFDFLFLASLLSFYPLYFLYIQSAFHYKFFLGKKIYHFLPAILFSLAMLIASYTANYTDYKMYMENNVFNTQVTSSTAWLLTSIYKGGRIFHIFQILIYTVLIIKFILKAKLNLNHFLSNTDSYQFRNFYLIAISFIVFMSVPGIFVTIIGRQPFNTNNYLLLSISLLFTLLYLILAIVGLKHIPANAIDDHITENQTIDISSKELQEIKLLLHNYFKTKKPWLNPNLNIWEVSNHLGTNRSYISKIINDDIGCNFNHYVNSYRVQEAKKLLEEKRELSLLQVSEQSGFGSINSFFRIFKLFENNTPADFRKKI